VDQIAVNDSVHIMDDSDTQQNLIKIIISRECNAASRI